MYNKSWEDPGDKGRLCSGGDVAAYSDLGLIPREESLGMRLPTPRLLNDIHDTPDTSHSQ